MAMRRLFGSIESGGLRRNALISAGEVFFWPYDKDKKAIRVLRALMRQVSDASDLRDDIAHGKVISLAMAGDMMEGQGVSYYHLHIIRGETMRLLKCQCQRASKKALIPFNYCQETIDTPAMTSI